jgi:sugar phosphate isomerase/epimerase
MKIGVADYGMTVWDGGRFDLTRRLKEISEIGYEGIERIVAVDAHDVIDQAAIFHSLSMEFSTCRGPVQHLGMKWTAALGKPYVWVQVSGGEFKTFCRQANIQAQACEQFGIIAAVHNHLGTPVESQEQLEEFLEKCPECGLIFDTAHLAAVGGDCIKIIEKYFDRIVTVHVKDWLTTNSEINISNWQQRGHFCELNGGNIGLDNIAILNSLKERGYDKWVFVEQDTHLRDPLEDLAKSRIVLKNAGF